MHRTILRGADDKDHSISMGMTYGITTEFVDAREKGFQLMVSKGLSNEANYLRLEVKIMSKEQLKSVLIALSSNDPEESFHILQRTLYPQDMKLSFNHKCLETSAESWCQHLKKFEKIPIWQEIKDFGFHELLPEK